MTFGDDFFGPIGRFVPIFLLLALGVTFLTAVADRFGLRRQFGAPNLAWGNFTRFTRTRDSDPVKGGLRRLRIYKDR